MSLDPTVKTLLNKFADTQIALRLAGKDLAHSNPKIGDAIDAALAVAAGSSSAAAAASSATAAASSATAAAASATTAAGYASYTPADTTKWTGADPTTVQQALDRIAAALGPIA